MIEKELGYLFGVSQASVTPEQLAALTVGKSEEYQAGALEGYSWAQSQEVETAEGDGGEGGTDGHDLGSPSFGGGLDEGGDDDAIDFGDSKHKAEMTKRRLSDDSEDYVLVEEGNDYKLAKRYNKKELKEAKENIDEDPEHRKIQKDGDDILVVEDDELDYNENDFTLNGSDVRMDSRKARRKSRRPLGPSVLEAALGEVEKVSDGFVTDLSDNVASGVKKRLGDKVTAQLDEKGYAISRKEGMFIFTKQWATLNSDTCVKGVSELLKANGVILSEQILSTYLNEALDVDGDVAALKVDVNAVKPQGLEFLSNVMQVKPIE